MQNKTKNPTVKPQSSNATTTKKYPSDKPDFYNESDINQSEKLWDKALKVVETGHESDSRLVYLFSFFCAKDKIPLGVAVEHCICYMEIMSALQIHQLVMNGYEAAKEESI